MSRAQRVAHVFVGLLMLVCGLALMADPEDGIIAIAAVIGFGFVAYGISRIAYYLMMARHMVGGSAMLFVGIVSLNVGSFALALLDQPYIFIVLFLVGYNGFLGLVYVYAAVETRSLDSGWVLKLVRGFGRLLLAAVCIVFIKYASVVAAIYCIVLFCSAIRHIVSAFRRSSIIFIQ